MLRTDFEALKWASQLQGTSSAYVSLYRYSSTGAGEVDLNESEIVRVVEKHDNNHDGDWWQVERSDGVLGMVPSNYLSPVPDHADAGFYSSRMRSLRQYNVMSGMNGMNGMNDMTSNGAYHRASAPVLYVPPPVGETLSNHHMEHIEHNHNHMAPPRPAPIYPTLPPGPEAEADIMRPRVSAIYQPPPYPQFHETEERKTMSDASSTSAWSLSEEVPVRNNPQSDSQSYQDLYEGVDGDPTTTVHELDARVNGSEPFIMVTVANPRKTGSIVKEVTWLVMTQTNLKGFKKQGFSIRRKYEDFVWLQDYLQIALPDYIVPPLPAATRKISKLAGGIDEHWIFKRTATLQTFISRITRHRVFKEDDMVRLLLEGTTAELKRAKRQKNISKDNFKHPSDSQKPDRDPRLMRSYAYFDTLLKHVKELREKSDLHIRNAKEDSNRDNKYHSVWKAIADHEPSDTFTCTTMSAMAREIGILEDTSSKQSVLREILYHQSLKDLMYYIKEAQNYIQRQYDIEDTLAYWTLQHQTRRESLSHKTITLNNVTSKSRPSSMASEPAVGADDASISSGTVSTRTVKIDIKTSKKQNAAEKDLNKKINVLEKKMAVTSDIREEAQRRFDNAQAIMWDELTIFDREKEFELQMIHKTWLQDKMALANKAIEHYGSLMTELTKPINDGNRAIR